MPNINLSLQHINIPFLQTILEGTFSKWNGDYNFLLLADKQYVNLDKSRSVSVQLANLLKGHPDVLRQIVSNEIRKTQEAFLSESEVIYTDLFGFTCITVPIVVESSCVAGLSFGYFLESKEQSTLDLIERNILSIIRRNSIQLSSSDDISKLIAQIPLISIKQRKIITERIKQTASFIPSLFTESLLQSQIAKLEERQKRAYVYADKLRNANVLMQQATELLHSDVYGDIDN